MPETKGDKPEKGARSNGFLLNPIYNGKKQELKVSQTDFVWDGERWSPVNNEYLGAEPGRLSGDLTDLWQPR